jgi:hypothetical protein
MDQINLPVNVQYTLAQMSGIVRSFTHQQVPGGNTAVTSSVDLNGMILTHVQVQLIFWGSAWAGDASPSANAVFNAAQTILSGPYMSKLSQYRGIGNGTMLGKLVINPSDPPNPFSTDNVAQCVLHLIGAGQVPKPEDDQQILYCVFLPVGVNFNQPYINGIHSFIYNASYSFPLEIDLDKVLFAWVLNDGTLDSITTIFSHELVESCTNPDGNGFQVTPLDPNNWHEIGDVCEGNSNTLDGVKVQAYWSQSDGGCIIPGLPLGKIF